MKKIFLIVLAVLCALLMTGCKSIDYGTVIDKNFTPAHLQIRRTIYYVNKRHRFHHRYVTIPDTWMIYVENEDGKEWWTVDEDYYNNVDIGDYVDRRQGDNDG